MSDIRVIKRVIEEHCAEIHSIKDLARFTNYSSETIRKDFVRSENTTLAVFIRKLKVEKAKRLPVTTNMTCGKVSRAIGYSRPDVAARMFRRLTGQTMTEYQDQMDD